MINDIEQLKRHEKALNFECPPRDNWVSMQGTRTIWRFALRRVQAGQAVYGLKQSNCVCCARSEITLNTHTHNCSVWFACVQGACQKDGHVLASVVNLTRNPTVYFRMHSLL